MTVAVSDLVVVIGDPHEIVYVVEKITEGKVYISGLHYRCLLYTSQIPVVIMEPLKGGKLARFRSDIERVFKDCSDESVASWAFRWVGSLPGVKVILSGMNEMDQLVDNINTFSDFKPITEEEYEKIEEVKNALLAIKAVDCTSCKYLSLIHI